MLDFAEQTGSGIFVVLLSLPLKYDECTLQIPNVNKDKQWHKNCNAWEYTRTTHVLASGAEGVNMEHAAQQGCVYQSLLKLTLRCHS
jgi:hypothetical protein